MMRSLYSGVSGLKNHQTRMDVIGNNIANVNTVGFKTSRVVFQDIFSQTSKSGSRDLYVDLDPTIQRNIGGTNPVQIGLGVKLATVDVLHTQAPITRTDNPFDVFIQGDGMFIVQDINENYYYTRGGNFYLDDEGFLVTAHGYFVMGYTYDLKVVTYDFDPDNPELPDTPVPASVEVDKERGLLGATPDDDGVLPVLNKIRLRVPNDENDPTDPDAVSTVDNPFFVDLVGFSVGNNGDVNVVINNISQTIAYLGIAMFSNFGGLDKAGNSLYRESPSSGQAVIGMALENGSGSTVGGGLEMANVDLANEFTDMIITQRGFQANSRVITVSDTLLEELINLKR